MTVVLCRPSLGLTSGAGRLIALQAQGLRAAGERVELYARHGRFKFCMKTGFRVRRSAPRVLGKRAESPRCLLVDHGFRLPEADVIFVHNLASEGLVHLSRDDWRREAAEDTKFFTELGNTALVVANSKLVQRGLVRHFGLDPARITVEYPGFLAARFSASRTNALRAAARRKLGIGDAVPLVGFVTSGDLAKRGLDVFLAAAERIAAARPGTRFLVAGSKRLPEPAARHPLVTSGTLIHRAKSARPEPWFAVLDVFLYPALFEEFGLVVAEALALGIPVLTSRRVGASECLPPAYARWLLDEPEASAFAALALELLADAELRIRLRDAGVERAAALGSERYVRATTEFLLSRMRAKEARRSFHGD